MEKNLTQASNRSWFIQAYFVVGTLIGLILLVTSSVSLVGLGTKQLLGVKPYPNYTPDFNSFDQQTGIDKSQLTPSQQEKFDVMAANYDKQKAEMEAYNQEDQSKRMEIAWSLATLIVGIPVFALHAPHVFKKNQG